MKKTKKIILAAVVILSVLTITTTANVIYKVHEAVETDITIKYEWDEDLVNELQFKNPFVVIDGVTYVPLREIMEMGNIDVEWDGNSREITLLDNSYFYLSYDQIFEKLFGFSIPDGVRFVNGFHSLDGKDHKFYAKYFVDDAALESFRDSLTTVGFYKWTVEDQNDQDLNMSFSGSDFKWWNLEHAKEATEVYEKVNKGVSVLSIWKYVAFSVEDGQNCVYISYN